MRIYVYIRCMCRYIYIYIHHNSTVVLSGFRGPSNSQRCSVLKLCPMQEVMHNSIIVAYIIAYTRVYITVHITVYLVALDPQ